MDPEQNAPPATSDAAEAPPGPTRTTTGRAWRLKTLGFALALALLGAWGYYDAFYEYPARGRLHADFMLRNYLQETDKAFVIATASVEDPAAEYRRLSTGSESSLTAVDRSRLAWLRAVSRIESLSTITRANREELERRAKDPSARSNTPTIFVDPRRTLNELSAGLAQANQPKPLAAYDLPVQYLFLVGGIVGCAYLVGLFFVVRSRVYRYDPADHRLTLPSGKSIVPADIALVDKRQWDKYIVYLKLADGSPEIRLDLYRHRPLEDWILEMEKLTPGYIPPEDEEPAEPTEAAT